MRGVAPRPTGGEDPPRSPGKENHTRSPSSSGPDEAGDGGWLASHANGDKRCGRSGAAGEPMAAEAARPIPSPARILAAAAKER